MSLSFNKFVSKEKRNNPERFLEEVSRKVASELLVNSLTCEEFIPVKIKKEEPVVKPRIKPQPKVEEKIEKKPILLDIDIDKHRRLREEREKRTEIEKIEKEEIEEKDQEVVTKEEVPKNTTEDYIKDIIQKTTDQLGDEGLVSEEVRQYVKEELNKNIRDLKIQMHKQMAELPRGAAPRDTGYGGTGSVATQYAAGGTMNGNLVITGTLSASGGVIVGAVVPVTSDTTITASQGDKFMVNASSDNIVLTLPPASENLNVDFSIKKTDSTSNLVTVSGNGTDTIDGTNTKVISVQYDSITITSDGTQWLII